MSFSGSMRGRILRSFGADALGQVLNVGVRLLLVPLFLSTWGAETYGEWLILTALAAWFGLGDLGGQLYFINRLTAEWSAGKIDAFQRVLSTGLLLFLVSSTLLFGCVLIAVNWIPVASWLGLKTVDQDLAEAILLLMALRFLASLPIGLFLGIYRAIGIQATSVMYGNLILMIQFVASALALLAGGGMLLLAILEVVPFLLVFVVVIWDLRRRLPKEVSLFELASADRLVLRSAISPSLHFLGIQLSSAIIIQGSVLVVAKQLGPVEVAIFSSMRIVANVMSRFMGVLSHAAWPEITRLAILGQDEKLAKLFTVILNLALFVGLCYLALIVNFGQMLYNWWLNNNLPYDFWVMYLLSCQVVMAVLWTWGGNLLMATNRHEEYARWQLPINLLAILLSYWGAVEFGLLGAVAGLFAGQSLPMLLIVYLLLVKKGWHQIAFSLVITSLAGLVLLPTTLNIWAGLVAVILCSGVIVLRNCGDKEK